MVNNELIEEMLKLPDVNFIEAAYGLILRREPDENGMKSFLLELILGKSRKTVLLAICKSEEGIRNDVVHCEDLELFFASKKVLVYESRKRKTGRIRRIIKRLLAMTLFREEYDQLIENRIELFRIVKEFSHVKTIQNESQYVMPLADSFDRFDEIKQLPPGVFDDFVKLRGGIF